MFTYFSACIHLLVKIRLNNPILLWFDVEQTK